MPANSLVGLMGAGTSAANALAPPMTPEQEMMEYNRQMWGGRYPQQEVARMFGLSNAPESAPIKGYRYDKRRQSLETLPSKFTSHDVKIYSEAIGEALRSGVPGLSEHISPEVVAAMLLKEGREDLGTNAYNKNDPESRKIYESYAKKYGRNPAEVVAAMYDKAKVAKRLGVPFARAWIGLGKSDYETSEQYAKDIENFRRAALDPKNAELLQFIRTSMTGPQLAKRPAR